MNRLNIWRWAQYTLLGVLVVSLSLFVFLPDRGQSLVEKITPKEVLPVTLAITAFAGYVIGMIVWAVSVTLRKIVTWPVFFTFRPLSKHTRSYREYRMMIFNLLASEFSEARNKHASDPLPRHETIKADIPDYTHFLLEVYRSGEKNTQYLGGKTVSAWQSCTLILSVLGCLLLGALLALGRLLVMLMDPGHTSWSTQLALFLALIGLYLLTGLASLERNRLLVRDVFISYVLRKQMEATEED